MARAPGSLRAVAATPATARLAWRPERPTARRCLCRLCLLLAACPRPMMNSCITVPKPLCSHCDFFAHSPTRRDPQRSAGASVQGSGSVHCRSTGTCATRLHGSWKTLDPGMLAESGTLPDRTKEEFRSWVENKAHGSREHETAATVRNSIPEQTKKRTAAASHPST